MMIAMGLSSCDTPRVLQGLMAALGSLGKIERQAAC